MFEIKDTGISIERFLRICSKNGFQVTNEQHYLFNPIYKYKFNLQPRTQWKWVSKIPFLRNFVTMGVYYTVRASQ